MLLHVILKMELREQSLVLRGTLQSTVHVAGHAIHAANYAAAKLPTERKWQYQQLLDLNEKQN